jgi:hypothetical protein
MLLLWICGALAEIATDCADVENAFVTKFVVENSFWCLCQPWLWAPPVASTMVVGTIGRLNHG